MSVVAPASLVQTGLVLTAGQTVTPAFDLTHAISGVLWCPAGLAAASIRFLVDPRPGAAPAGQLVVLANTPLSTPAAASTWTPLPQALFGFRSAVLQLAGAEGADRGFILALVKRQTNWTKADGNIPSGSQNGALVATKGAVAGSLALPTGLTGTALTWQISGDGNVWTTAKDTGGTAIVQTYAAPQLVPVPTPVLGAPYLRAQVAGAQAAERVLEYQLRRLG